MQQQSGERAQEYRQQNWEAEPAVEGDLEYELARLPRTNETLLSPDNNGQYQDKTMALRPPALPGVDLYQRDLSFRYLARANLRDAKLVGANFSRANLSRAHLSGADLSHADLSGADLSHADLRNALLTGANLRDANLQNAVLIGANLLGVSDLTTEQVLTAIRDNSTQLDINVDITLRVRSMRRSMLTAPAESASQEAPAHVSQGDAPDSTGIPLLMPLSIQQDGKSPPLQEPVESPPGKPLPATGVKRRQQTAVRDNSTQLDRDVDTTLRVRSIRRSMPTAPADSTGIPLLPPLSIQQDGKSPPLQEPVKFPPEKRRQPSTINRRSGTIPTLLTAHKQNDLLLFIVIFVIVLSLTPLLVVAGANIGFSLVLAGIAGLLLTAMVVRWPVSGFYVIVGCILLIEQEPLQYPILTDRLYIFYWPPNLAGFVERPIGVIMLFVLLVLVLHRLAKRQRPLWGGALFLPFLFFLLCVAFGVVHGLVSGGDFKIIVLEVRPLWYLFLSYLLGYNLVTQKDHIRNFLWAIIIGAGVKGIQGTYIVMIYLHGHLQGQNEIMAHEESFFFVALLLLVILFSLHYNYRPQFFTALLVMPCLLVALIANNRRADYIALLIGIMVAWSLIFLVKPQARKGLAIGMIIFLVLGTGYVLGFASVGGSFGEPARAIISVVKPNLADARDIASNLYRTIEDYDLKYTVKLNPLGLGFGKPFLQPEILPNIITLDPYYNYVPHNTIYWIWMRLGPIGYLALWYLFGTIIIRGCLIARQLRDRYLQLVAIYVVAVVFMEVVVAFADYQLFFYRNVIYLGLLTGILMKLPALDEKKEQPIHESARSDRRLTASGVGS